MRPGTVSSTNISVAAETLDCVNTTCNKYAFFFYNLPMLCPFNGEGTLVGSPAPSLPLCQWMIAVESLRIQNLCLCIDALHKLIGPKMFQVPRLRSELFANKGHMYRVNYNGNGYYFVNFWETTAVPTDIIIPLACWVPCKQMYLARDTVSRCGYFL